MQGWKWTTKRALRNALPLPNCGTWARCDFSGEHLRLSCWCLRSLQMALILGNNLWKKAREKRRKKTITYLGHQIISPSPAHIYNTLNFLCFLTHHITSHALALDIHKAHCLAPLILFSLLDKRAFSGAFAGRLIENFTCHFHLSSLLYSLFSTYRHIIH